MNPMSDLDGIDDGDAMVKCSAQIENSIAHSKIPSLKSTMLRSLDPDVTLYVSI
ncbi:MAG: hypothetical protein Q4P71_09900 [Actinomycetaceae bacterium]|nr:hypothetical protein [Actinomycetaceae bacterium]